MSNKWIDKDEWEAHKKWEEESLEELSSPDTIKLGGGVWEWYENMVKNPPKKLTRKEFDELLNSEKKTQTHHMYMGREGIKAWEEAIRNLIEKNNE